MPRRITPRQPYAEGEQLAALTPRVEEPPEPELREGPQPGVAAVLALQRTAGNQAVQRFVNTGEVTSKAKKANRSFTRGKSSLRGLLDAVDYYNAGDFFALENELRALESIAVRASVAYANPRKTKYRATAALILDQLEQETVNLIDRVIAEYEERPSLVNLANLGKLADSLRIRPDHDRYAAHITRIQGLIQAGAATDPAKDVTAIVKDPRPKGARRDGEDAPGPKLKFKVRLPEPEPDLEEDEEGDSDES